MEKEKELLLEALKQNELIDYLEGVGKYKLELDQWVNASAPTDWTKIIPKGIYKVYKENPELKVDILLEEALMEMLNRDAFDIYVAVSVIYFQFNREHRGDAPFVLNRDKLLTHVRKSLNVNEEKLKNYDSWEGKGKSNGIWEEMERFDTLCQNKWNFSIIK